MSHLKVFRMSGIYDVRGVTGKFSFDKVVYDIS